MHLKENGPVGRGRISEQCIWAAVQPRNYAASPFFFCNGVHRLNPYGEKKKGKRIGEIEHLE